MKKGRGRFEKRGLLVLLGVLCVVIVGLGVGIVVICQINQNNDVASNDDIESDMVSGQTKLEASIAAGYYPGNEKTQEAYEHNYEYLTKMIETGYTDDNQELGRSDILFLQMVLARLMIEYNEGVKAIDYLDQIDQNELAPKELEELYVLYSLAYESINDQDNALEYADMASFIYEDKENE